MARFQSYLTHDPDPQYYKFWLSLTPPIRILIQPNGYFVPVKDLIGELRISKLRMNRILKTPLGPNEVRKVSIMINTGKEN
jgi:hypothetical protein